MEQNRKKELLWKYENGETTLQEEAELKSFFLDSVEASDSKTKTIFGFYKSQKQIVWNENFKIIEKKSSKDKWLGLAASLILVFGLVFVLTKNRQEMPTNSLALQSSNNPEEVLKETQKALELLSVQVNSGIGSMRYLKEYQKSKDKIFKE